ncbi:MAG: hypothetical protein ACI8RZ_006983 [Myxococcota bacterium]|jgi:hypothetical protein
MFFLLTLLPLHAADRLNTIGILKRAGADGGCRDAWFMGTDANNPQQFCLNVSAMPADLRAMMERLFDEEVSIEGHYDSGAVRITGLSTDLTARNGVRPALDYHLDPVTSTRSHDLGARLRETPTARIRIQPPTTPALIEIIFQGIPMEADVAGLMKRLQFVSGSETITPAAQMLGTTLVLTMPTPAPGQLLRIQPTQGGDLVAVLTDGLFGGVLQNLSMTLLLSPAVYDTP